MSKSTNRRKSIAIALAVLGVAGLSLASAAQLNFSGNNTVQSGALDLSAACQSTKIPVTFSAPTPSTTSPKTYSSATVTLGSIDTTCADGAHKYKAAVLNGTTVLVNIDETTLAANATSISIPLTGVDTNVITTVALTIYN